MTRPSPATVPVGAVLHAVDLEVRYPGTDPAAHPALRLDGLDVAPGDSLALVGESGSGKTTALRALLGLVRSSAAALTYDGAPVATMSGERLRAYRRAVQLIPQDVDGALDPRQTIGSAIGEGWRAGGRRIDGVAERAGSGPREPDVVRALLDEVGLPEDDRAPPPARALRWPASARRHRPRPRGQPPAAAPGRAHQRPGYHGPGAHPGTHRAAPGGPRPGHPAHQPQPRRRRAALPRHARPLPGRGRGVGAHRGPPGAAATSLHRGAATLRAGGRACPSGCPGNRHRRRTRWTHAWAVASGRAVPMPGRPTARRPRRWPRWGSRRDPCAAPGRPSWGSWSRWRERPSDPGAVRACARLGATHTRPP